MITIKNLRDEKPTQPWQVRVDRQSVFGNPYKIDLVDDRDSVCEQYEKLFHSLEYFQSRGNALRNLVELYDTYGKLELFCWCAPKRCHAETIKKWLEEKL